MKDSHFYVTEVRKHYKRACRAAIKCKTNERFACIDKLSKVKKDYQIWNIIQIS